MSDDNEVDMSKTIVAKSDQMNADDLVSKPITVTVTGVCKGSKDQPVIIAVSGGHQPYKPCKTMRRMLVAAWGEKGSSYVGKSMTLYRNPAVRWSGEEVGGIEISHMSHISAPVELSLQVSRGKKKKFVIHPLKVVSSLKDSHAAMKQRWKESRDKTGQSVTVDAFREWVAETTDNAVPAKDALAIDKYTQALIDRCLEAIDEPNPRTEQPRQNEAFHSLRNQIHAIRSSADAERFGDSVMSAKDSGEITSDEANELSELLRKEMA